jgi:hypothetical protein
MSKDGSSGNFGGISVLSLLGVSFVILKLTGYIDWSWWYVTLPFWGGLSLFFGFLLLVVLIKVFVGK